MTKEIFSFDDKSARKLKDKKNILGGKGANLGEMGRLGLPVPPGFTITTKVCDIFYKNKKKIPSNITTIRHFKIDNDNNFMSYGSSTKNLYLILLEDL